MEQVDSVSSTGAAVGRKWTKRVQNEWKILQNNLPDTVQYNMMETNFNHGFLECLTMFYFDDELSML